MRKRLLICVLAALLSGVLFTPSLGAEERDVDAEWDDNLVQDIQRVPPHLRKGLKRYHLPSLLKVARAYEFGEGVPKNLDLAVSWYTRAANICDPVAKAWLEKETERGEIISLVYRKGDELRRYGDRNLDLEGMALIRKAADAGYLPAERTIGLASFKGEDIPRDFDVAVTYLKRAAENRDTWWESADHVTFGTLGEIYDDGQSGYYNPQQAYYFLLISSRIFPGYNVTDWVKGYDKVPEREKAFIKKQATQWKQGMPLWEAPPWSEQPAPQGNAE